MKVDTVGRVSPVRDGATVKVTAEPLQIYSALFGAVGQDTHLHYLTCIYVCLHLLKNNQLVLLSTSLCYSVYFLVTVYAQKELSYCCWTLHGNGSILFLTDQHFITEYLSLLWMHLAFNISTYQMTSTILALVPYFLYSSIWTCFVYSTVLLYV